jgi:hypothetical protein
VLVQESLFDIGLQLIMNRKFSKYWMKLAPDHLFAAAPPTKSLLSHFLGRFSFLAFLARKILQLEFAAD